MDHLHLARIASDLLWAETSERRGSLFIDIVAPPPRLILFGAVDVAASLCKLARVAGWRPFVVDPRARFAAPERFPDAEEVIAAWPEEAFARLGGIDPATSIAVLTHDPKLDDLALMEALKSPAFYVGALGSRANNAKRRQRLEEFELTREQIERLHGPIGIYIGSRTPPEIAISILAEITAAKNDVALPDITQVAIAKEKLGPSVACATSDA